MARPQDFHLRRIPNAYRERPQRTLPSISIHFCPLNLHSHMMQTHFRFFLWLRSLCALTSTNRVWLPVSKHMPPHLFRERTVNLTFIYDAVIARRIFCT